MWLWTLPQIIKTPKFFQTKLPQLLLKYCHLFDGSFSSSLMSTAFWVFVLQTSMWLATQAEFLLKHQQVEQFDSCRLYVCLAAWYTRTWACSPFNHVSVKVSLKAYFCLLKCLFTFDSFSFSKISFDLYDSLSSQQTFWHITAGQSQV